MRTVIALWALAIAAIFAPAFEGPRTFVCMRRTFRPHLHRIIRTPFAARVRPSVGTTVGGMLAARGPARKSTAAITFAPPFTKTPVGTRTTIIEARTLRTPTVAIAALTATVTLFAT